jgi:hypothetical protein
MMGVIIWRLFDQKAPLTQRNRARWRGDRASGFDNVKIAGPVVLFINTFSRKTGRAMTAEYC